MTRLGPLGRGLSLSLLVIAVLGLSLVGVYFQAGKLGLEYLRTEQLERHDDVIEGTAPDPWQYRLLSEYAVEGWLRLLEFVGLQDPVPLAFLSARIFQNALILTLGFLYYRRLGLDPAAAFVGLGVVTWSMTHSLFDSDLSFNTYTELAAYLLAGLIVLSGRIGWLIPLVMVGTLNRETIAFVPLLLLSAEYRRGRRMERRVARLSVACLLVFVLEYVGIRLLVGPRPLKLAYGHRPGIDLMTYNLFRAETWSHLAATMNIFPIVAVVYFRHLKPILKRWMIVLAPAWLGVHLVLAVLAETRLLLVPQVLVFVPAALMAIGTGGRRTTNAEMA